MAGTNELHLQENEDSFLWDEHSQLYYHASSGFYHDPSAGWYYSSKDGLYYKFENGNYVPWETDQVDESIANQNIVTIDNKLVDDVKLEDGEIEGYVAEEETLNEPIVDTESLTTNGMSENLPPPSEWLEDTLIELYLSGYSNQTTDNARTLEDDNSLNTPLNGVENDTNDDDDELEEGEWIPDEPHEIVYQDEVPFGEEEEMWRAQYGQPIQSDKEVITPNFPVVDLWDWSMVTITTKKRRKHRVCRLVGRLVKRSTKLHPSMPSSGRILKTAPICEVHLDLVKVKSGRVYKLKTPKAAYLASLSSYDSSNPTKDWGFPELSLEKEIQPLTKSIQNIEPKVEGVCVEKVGLAKEVSTIEKHKGHAYRDRAAERRTLHGGFGVGPGQKKSAADDVDFSSSPNSGATTEEAAAEALNMSFGAGSYARKLLENMGWKEGESLGSSMKGLTEPLQAVGNKGSSGLGWNQNNNRRHI